MVLRLASHGGVRARWPRSPTGAEVRVRGRMLALGPADEYERRRGAHAQISVDRLEPTGRRRGGMTGALDGVRRRAEQALSSALPPGSAALGRGMVLGQDDALADDVREDFRTSGLAHLLAASGTNVALLAALVLGVATAAGVGLTGRLLLAIAAVAAYVPLAGGGPSIQRAGVMGGAALLAMLVGRPSSRWYALLLAAAATLTLNPYALGDVGWQLSFAAVVSLLAVGPRARAVAAQGGAAAGRRGAGAHARGDRGHRAARRPALRAPVGGVGRRQPPRRAGRRARDVARCRSRRRWDRWRPRWRGSPRGSPARRSATSAGWRGPRRGCPARRPRSR